jgi:hypothetical protein
MIRAPNVAVPVRREAHGAMGVWVKDRFLHRIAPLPTRGQGR